MPPTTYPLSGEAVPPPNTRDALTSLHGVGQGDPREPQGTQGYKGAFGTLGGMGPRAPLGVIPKPFRMEPRFDWMVITKRLRN